jgi:hypothetical protein
MAMRRAQTQSAFDRLDANDQAALVRGLRALVAALSEPVSIAPFTSTDQ